MCSKLARNRVFAVLFLLLAAASVIGVAVKSETDASAKKEEIILFVISNHYGVMYEGKETGGAYDDGKKNGPLLQYAIPRMATYLPR